MKYPILLVLMLLAGMLPACSDAPDAGPQMEQVVIGGRTFTLEVAADEESRRQGLMNRTSLDEDRGMLFVFPTLEMQSFWMGNTLIDLDIIFLDGLGYITATHEMKAGPPRQPNETEFDYQRRTSKSESVMPAQFAIEVKGGMLRSLGLKEGDKIALDLARLKALAR